MRKRALRRLCRELLADLEITPPLDVDELCQRLGALRGREVRLRAYPIPATGPSGAWIAGTDADYVFYQRHTTVDHQRHIILHELGHIIAGHDNPDGGGAFPTSPDGSEVPDPESLELPPGESGTVPRVLLRTCYDTEQEKEAETVATLVLEWASVLDTVAEAPPTSPTARTLETSLRDRWGWL